MQSLEPVLFEIPVLPRIKKFISAKLVDENGQPQPFIVGPDLEGAGLMVWLMAQSKKVMLQIGLGTRPGKHADYRAGGGRILALEEMSVRLGLGICEFHSSRGHELLNVAELNVFNNMVDYMILNEMVTYCEASSQIAPMTLIKQFTDRYDFSEDDLTDGACKQAYLRYRWGTGAFSYNPKVVKLGHFLPRQLQAA